MLHQLYQAYSALCAYEGVAIKFGSIFTSIYAIVAYVIILFIIMIALVFSLASKENSAPHPMILNMPELIAPNMLRSYSKNIQDMQSEENAEITTSLAAGYNGRINSAIINQESTNRFFMLSRLDEQIERFIREDYDNEITLKELCDRFRNFAASRLKLYYDIEDIRRFIAGLAVSPIIILQGISGTGKTSLGFALGEFLDNPSAVVPVQPMWKERTDLVGYYNEFTKRFNETVLLQKLYEANYSEDIFVTILDEMNIARIEYYFAEFLSLLELPNPNSRYLDVVSDEWPTDPKQLVNGQIKLPQNMWFIGTANNDDSTFSISDKVYDRAMVLTLDNKAEPFHAPKTNGVCVSAARFRQLAKDAKKEYRLSRRNEQRLEMFAEMIYKYFRIGFGNRIRKQIALYIPVYLSCGGQELDALDDILAKKVMRKLETQNTIYIKNAIEPFCRELDELFGEDNMTQCKSYITTLSGKR